ncbi:glycosyltransferase family 4 protein [Acidobacteriota bacterium]
MRLHYLQMRIGFDIRPFLRQATGVGIYYKNLLFSLARIDSKNQYYLFSSSYKDRFHQEELPPFAQSEFRDARYPVKLMNFLWQRLEWPPLDKFFNTELDLTHSPIPLLLPTKGKKIVTVYDLFFMDFPEFVQGETRKSFTQRIENSLQRADGILVISQFVKDQIMDRFFLNEDKIKVVYLGVDPGFSNKPSVPQTEIVKNKYGLPSRFLLFVGDIEPRKNLGKLIEALEFMQKKSYDIPLVIVGKEGMAYQNLVKKIEDSQLQSKVMFLNYLPDGDLKILYRLASCLVFPSLCEGFGLPLVEAMASGCPLVISRASALPEIALNAALYFHPEDSEEMAGQIMTVLNDEDLRKNLIEKGNQRVLDFSWTQTAENTLNFYKAVIGKGSLQ